MSLQPGARLGPYEILAAIGSGGMGEVYRCRDTRVPRTTVALKVLAPAVAEDSDFRKRFAREARIIADLDHPHICALYDVGEVEGISFIVMPILEGRSLASRLDQGAIPVAEALRIAIAVASALAYAHGRGVLHRDVKPSNIMLGADGSVKLLDFGIARTTGTSEETRTDTTKSGHILGTLEYMSPEQLSGRDVDERSDIFSLAVVLYEMVAGRHPFRTGDRMFTMCAILDCEYPPIASNDPVVQAVDATLAKSMAHDPAAREQSMQEFLQALESIRGGMSVTPAPAPAVYATWNARTIGTAFAATAVIAILAVLWGNVTAGVNDTNRPAPVSDDPLTPSPTDSLVESRPVGTGGIPRSNTYDVVSKAPAAFMAGSVSELGVTVWRMRRATNQDHVRLLVHETSATEEWTAERIALGTPVAIGDRLRLSVESPREGYLYVVDRERYADGTMGVPHVIFPTLHTSAGNNRLSSGRLVDIPSQADRPPYFTLRQSRPDQVAEVLTLIVSARPVPELTPRDRPLVVTPALVEQWEARGASQVIEQLELTGGAGRAWSIEEQQAAADATRVLTQDAPAPQTVFRIVTKEPGFFVTQVVLAHKR